MATLDLHIVTPEREVLNEQVDEVVLPSVNGSMGVLPGHAPLMALMDIGQVEYRKDGKRTLLAVSGGFAEVGRNTVRVLADTCEAGDEIDVERARRARERGERLMDEARSEESRFKVAEVRIRRAINRIRVYERSQGSN